MSEEERIKLLSKCKDIDCICQDCLYLEFVKNNILNPIQEENQELKRKLNEAIHKATEFESEVYELEKQLEEYKRLGFKHLNDKCNKLENQQKEFIDYMNKTIEELECDDFDNEEMKGYLIQRIDTFKEILQKYKEIIGVEDEFEK